jgi:hypothetical protein
MDTSRTQRQRTWHYRFRLYRKIALPLGLAATLYGVITFELITDQPGATTTTVVTPSTITLGELTPQQQADRVAELNASTTTSTSTTTVVLVDPAVYGQCGEYHDMAIQAGWSEEQWPTLSRVMWKESRCTTDAWNGHDAGLTQINQIHTDWLAEMGFSHPDDMFSPYNNLLFAYRLWNAREQNGQCGWTPWSIKCN